MPFIVIERSLRGLGMLEHLVVRIRNNAVAYYPAPPCLRIVVVPSVENRGARR